MRRLRVYHAAEEMALLVYGVCRALPGDERFSLGQQLRRASVSVGSNIAEGAARGGTAERSRFLYIALGSATEIEFQLGPVVKLKLPDHPSVEPALRSCLSVQRMLTRLIVRRRPAPGASRGRP